jgi:hypothetical protein
MQSRMRACLVSGIAAAVAVVLGGTALAQAANPHIGTWKLNVAKSKWSPGPALTSSTTKIEAAGAGVKYTVDQMQASGTALHWTFTANYDGKDNPIVGNNPNGDMTALTRVDANTVKNVTKKAGKVTTSQTSAISVDGKTRTVTTTGTNPQGQTVNNVAVYDKQ